MNYNIGSTSMVEIRSLFNQYLLTLTGVVDDFWEEHITNAKFYVITIDDSPIGYFAIYNKEKLTQFYIIEEYLNLAQPVFSHILEEYQIQTAYVATCDQLFLSLCMDHHRKVELQAYFFDGTITGKVRPPEYPRECLCEVAPQELEQVKHATGDFFEFLSKENLEKGLSKLYKLCQDEEVLGYGIIVPNAFLKQYWACGMITIESKRQKGVGRSIQLHLGDICKENGFIPISGCWYYNHLSKKTIESAGRYSKTRLLNISFHD